MGERETWRGLWGKGYDEGTAGNEMRGGDCEKGRGGEGGAVGKEMGYREGTVGKVIQEGDYGGKRYREGTAGEEMRGEECGDRDTGMGVRRELWEQECREWHKGDDSAQFSRDVTDDEDVGDTALTMTAARQVTQYLRKEGHVSSRNGSFQHFYLCLALQYFALPCSTLPCNTLPCLAVHCLAVHCLALPCNTVCTHTAE